MTEKDRVAGELQRFIIKSQWEKAVEAVGRLCRLEPGNPVHRLRSGDYYLKLGKPDRAAAAYHEAAGMFERDGFVVKALAAYKMILRVNPGDSAARNRMQGLHETARRQAEGESPRPPASEPSVNENPAASAGGHNVLPLFSTLSPEAFNAVAEGMVRTSVPPGFTIVREGDAGDSVFLICRGTVRVFTLVEGREISLGDLGENDFFGEVGFLTGRPRTASVVARTEAELLELGGENLRGTISRHPEVRGVLDTFYKARVKDAFAKVKNPGP